MARNIVGGSVSGHFGDTHCSGHVPIAEGARLFDRQPQRFDHVAPLLDFGGKHGSATASGIIDGVGYLGGMLAGDTVSRVSLSFGWTGAFLALAGVALLSSGAAAMLFMGQRRAVVAQAA